MKENKIGFRLSKVNWVLALIVIGISSFIFLKRDGVNGFSLGFLSASIGLRALILLFFAFMVYLIKGKKPYAGTYTFNGVLIFMCLGMMTEIGNINRERSEGVEALTNSISDYKDKIINEEDGLSAYQEHSANIDNGLSKIIANSTGNDQKVYQNLQKFTYINNAVMINWQKAFDSVSATRILDYSVLNNQAEFEYQIDVLEHYKEQSKLYRDHFYKRKSIIDDLNDNIPKSNLTLKGVMKGINNKDSIQIPIFKPFIQSHINYSENLIAMINFLQKNNEKWSYSDDEIIFDNTELERKFNEIIDLIIEDEDQINELTDSLVEVI
ncbi:hypothetical protein [Dokdonia sp. PRO95]|uniref:hypothetical protein n=1 Tax=Dokdonia sp. PRO95 TaxID=1239415 RepID=UPI000A539926|nr:hypothetical protein [Dokdonia sp. PRO95]